ncbi:MAG: hypothetical protein ACRDRN_01680 [Sciscionella sp.]
MAATSTLRVAGVAGYEGGLGRHADSSTLDAVAGYCGALRKLAGILHENGIGAGEQIISAGGSAFFDVAVRELSTGWAPDFRPTVVLRSGAYLTHDDGFYAGISPIARNAAGALSLQPALRLWAQVLSRPEPELALLAAGRRDVSFDEGLPVPVRIRRRDGSSATAADMAVTALNDQHAYLRVPADRGLAPGDLVCLGISHPCTTFDKWRVIPLVDGEDRVIDAVHTFF